MSSVTHLLKVLNGPHTGAQSGFGPEEKLVIGSAPEADIILSDPHILPHHCKIEFSGTECIIIALEGEVLLDGKLLTEPAPIDASHIITIGSTSLVVGVKDGVWPPLIIPDQKNIGNALVAQEVVTQEPPPASKKEGMITPLRIIIFSLMVVVILIFASSLFFIKSENKVLVTPTYPGKVEIGIEERNKLRTQTELETLKNILHRDMPQVTIIRHTHTPGTLSRKSSGGDLLVLAPDENAVMKAREIVALFRKAIYVQVINLTEANSLLHGIIAMQAPRVLLAIQPNGVLLWKGYLRSHAEYPKLRDAVHQDFPFLEKDEDHLHYGEEIRDTLTSMMTSIKGSSSISMKLDDQGIILTGKISPENELPMKELLTRMRNLYADVVFTDRITVVADRTEVPSILGGKVAGVTFGKSAWIELTNGIRIFPGTRLPNGMTLLAITQSSISFQTSSGIITMPLETVTSQH